MLASQPMLIGLGDDIPPGPHKISLSVVGSGVRVFARFFSYGASARTERISTFGETRSTETWEQSSP